MQHTLNLNATQYHTEKTVHTERGPVWTRLTCGFVEKANHLAHEVKSVCLRKWASSPSKLATREAHLELLRDYAPTTPLMRRALFFLKCLLGALRVVVA